MAKKKVVRVESDPEPRGETRGETRGDSQEAEPTWTPTAEAKSKATKLRLAAAVLWLLAIAGEVYAIFGVLNADDVNMVLLIGLIVVIGILAVAGSLLWKQANRLDPARRSEPTRFFIQNQLGAIITVIAFLPLIVLILLNKDMSGREKALAGGLGVVVMLVAGYFGTELNPSSVEQYTEETNTVEDIVGENLVYWTKEGNVFHLCAEASDVNRESKDGKIYEGTVAQAHEAGKDRLTKKIAQETRECGFDKPDEPTDGPAEEPTDEES
ncbi:mechanosensitive ion channel family protein [Nocardioides speluncae]|uniref:mechanosensitive ion channel family protein n=1 Tax=Nocardioides speluncae TaxID=2670337 RepID=UPI000D68B20D|nr:mechanosensitive ion channel family protein [Nocardioides speluncae]